MYVGSGRVFATMSLPFLLLLPCHYAEVDISVLTGTTARMALMPLVHQEGCSPAMAKCEVRSQEGKPRGGKKESELVRDAPSRRITES